VKKKIAYLLFLFAASGIFAEESVTINTKTLIMGWAFEEEDSYVQTNLAVDAALKYAEAALYQMNSYEKYDTSCRIELYKEKFDYIYFTGSVYIYINGKSAEDYHDRYIEINFYTGKNGIGVKYKLVLYYNGYNWMKNNPDVDEWDLILNDMPAYNFFVYEIEKFRR
jgi:hypothetical protein